MTTLSEVLGFVSALPLNGDEKAYINMHISNAAGKMSPALSREDAAVAAAAAKLAAANADVRKSVEAAQKAHSAVVMEEEASKARDETTKALQKVKADAEKKAAEDKAAAEKAAHELDAANKAAAAEAQKYAPIKPVTATTSTRVPEEGDQRMNAAGVVESYHGGMWQGRASPPVGVPVATAGSDPTGNLPTSQL